MIPSYQDCMRPLLETLSTKPDEAIKLQDAVDSLAKRFQLSEEERNQFLPSGQYRLFNNRVSWAKVLRIPTFIFSIWFPIKEGLTPQITFFLLFHNEKFSGSFWLNSNKTILASLLSYLIGNDDGNLASQPLSQ